MKTFRNIQVLGEKFKLQKKLGKLNENIILPQSKGYNRLSKSNRLSN